MISAIDDDQVGEPVQARKSTSRLTYDYLAKQAAISSRVHINALSRDLDSLKKSENVGKQADALAEIRGMLGDLGLRVKTTVTPTVLDFLRDQYSVEKKLQDDARRHVENYVTLFARITENKNLSESGSMMAFRRYPKSSALACRCRRSILGISTGLEYRLTVSVTAYRGACQWRRLHCQIGRSHTD